MSDPFDSDAARNASRAADLKAAWARWLRGFAWDHYVSFTPRYVTPANALLLEFRTYVRRMERMTQCRVFWFAIVERGLTDRRHVHGLLKNTSGLTLDQVRRWWKLGDTHAVRYNPRDRAACYVVKEMPRMLRDGAYDDYDLARPERGE